MTIGQKIKGLRVQNRFSQRALAKEIKVSPSTICFWENDEIVPRMHKLQLMANLFGVPISYFVQDVEIAKKDELIAIYSALNEEGKEKLLEYGQMLVAMGYIKNNKISMGNQAI